MEYSRNWTYGLAEFGSAGQVVVAINGITGPVGVSSVSCEIESATGEASLTLVLECTLVLCWIGSR